ncbi:hypothetical protein HZA57_07660 [Candidatus Poribacteria bacterium]|nr:hypothetical protein [Candidatus Poribacteria bacterium]
MLQRLAVLTRTGDHVETRQFVSEDFANAARTGDVKRFVESPFNSKPPFAKEWIHDLTDSGAEILQFDLGDVKNGQLEIAIRQATKLRYGTLAADVLKVCMLRREKLRDPIVITEACISSLCVDDLDGPLESTTFDSCLIGTLDFVMGSDPTRLPRIQSSCIGALRGCLRKEDVPEKLLLPGTTVQSFEPIPFTPDAILESNLPLPVRVLWTILKKLYVQKGAGRRENALRRGLDHRAARYVSEILEALRKSGFAQRNTALDTEPVWYASRSMRERAMRILSNPHDRSDPLVAEVADLASR